MRDQFLPTSPSLEKDKNAQLHELWRIREMSRQLFSVEVKYLL